MRYMSPLRSIFVGKLLPKQCVISGFCLDRNSEIDQKLGPESNYPSLSKKKLTLKAWLIRSCRTRKLLMRKGHIKEL
eukprot:5145089-Amphidinium_carterae.1